MPVKQDKAVQLLSEAKRLVAEANANVQLALRNTDVGDEYALTFTMLLEDLTTDIEDISSGEVYEFKE